jgi:hypothetical protein
MSAPSCHFTIDAAKAIFRVGGFPEGWFTNKTSWFDRPNEWRLIEPLLKARELRHASMIVGC